MARCISPVSVPHPHGTKRSVRLTVPCGRCLNCFQNKRASWTLRLLEELKVCNTAYFVTLTYTDENLSWVISGEEEFAQLEKEHVKAFLKRLRSNVDRMYKNKSENSLERLRRLPIRHYLVGEYSPKLRPHYHVILFNLPKLAENYIIKSWSVGTKEYHLSDTNNMPVEKTKPLGFVHIGDVTQASIQYTTKYILDALFFTGNFSDLKNSEGEWKVQKPFMLTSNNMGINYVKKNKNYHRNNEIPYYTLPGNIKQGLPRYYKDKIFDEHQKKYFAILAEEENNKKDAEELRIRKKKGISEEYLIQQYKNKVYNSIKQYNKRKL